MTRRDLTFYVFGGVAIDIINAISPETRIQYLFTAAFLLLGLTVILYLAHAVTRNGTEWSFHLDIGPDVQHVHEPEEDAND